MERLLAGLFGYKPVKILEPEIDIAPAGFQRIRLVAEVKWVEKLTRRELRHVEEKLARFPDAQALLIVPDKTIVPETWLEVWDTKDLAAQVRQQAST